VPDGGHPDAVVGGEIVSGEEVMSGGSVWWSVLSPPDLTFTWDDYPALYQTISEVLDTDQRVDRQVSVAEAIRLESIETNDKQAATEGESALIQSAPVPVGDPGQQLRRSTRLKDTVLTAVTAVALTPAATFRISCLTASKGEGWHGGEEAPGIGFIKIPPIL
jgi:hypothetical protein